MDYYQRFGQRALAVGLGFLGLIVAAPLAELGAAGVRVTDERVEVGGLLYRHAISRAGIVRVEPVSRSDAEALRVARYGRIAVGTDWLGWYEEGDGARVSVSADVSRELVRIVPREGAALVVEAGEVEALHER